METLTLREFKAKADSGIIFTVKFIKRTTGEERVMNCRRGVSKGVKGVGLGFDPDEKGLLVVWDMQKLEEGATEKGAFRMINLEDLRELKMQGKRYAWSRDHFVEL